MINQKRNANEMKIQKSLGGNQISSVVLMKQALKIALAAVVL